MGADGPGGPCFLLIPLIFSFLTVRHEAALKPTYFHWRIRFCGLFRDMRGLHRRCHKGTAEIREIYRTSSRGNTDFPLFAPSRTRTFLVRSLSLPSEHRLHPSGSFIQNNRCLVRNAKMKINKEQEDPPESC